MVCKLDYTPQKQTWNLKMDPWKFGDSYWKPSFPGSMLNLGGVRYDTSLKELAATRRNDGNAIDVLGYFIHTVILSHIDT